MEVDPPKDAPENPPAEGQPEGDAKEPPKNEDAEMKDDEKASGDSEPKKEK